MIKGSRSLKWFRIALSDSLAKTNATVARVAVKRTCKTTTSSQQKMPKQMHFAFHAKALIVVLLDKTLVTQSLSMAPNAISFIPMFTFALHK